VLDGLGLELTGPDEAAGIICTGPFDDTVDTPEDYKESFAALSARNLPMICANPDLVVDRGGIRIYCAGALAKAYEEASSSAYAGEDYCEWLNEYVKEIQVGNLTIIKGCKEEHCAGVKDDTITFSLIGSSRCFVM